MNKLMHEQFEKILNEVVLQLSKDLSASDRYHDPDRFEQHVRKTLYRVCQKIGLSPVPNQHPLAFPDVSLNGFGVEIKFTKKDRWRAVGNSVFESMRTDNINHVYVIFGKAGGIPKVRWEHYGKCVKHVRVSHAPRFVIDMEEEQPSLFETMDIGYDEFWRLSRTEKMKYVREYSGNKLEKGERSWWLGEEKEPHTLPMQVRIYTRLPQDEKRKLRAEAAIIAPQICKGPHGHDKYIDAALYLLTQHGVFCPQARDLFSAGSVALRRSKKRGGRYILRALQDIEGEMREAAKSLDGQLLVEYWGEDYPVEKRTKEWLRRADKYALGSGWQPSEHLFLDG